MKHQYVGDINDYRKYALLRALSADGKNRIGVCWMLTPPDGSSDGGKLAYLQQANRYRHFDPTLFDILAHSAAEPDQRRLQTIEDSDAISGAAYFNDILPDDRVGRASFMTRCSSQFRNADLVFFDPDNGLEVSLPKGRKNSSKYLYLDEVAAFYDHGKSLLIYQHFPRIERSTFMAQRAEQLRSVAGDCAIWAFTTAHVVFFLLVHPESPARLAIAVMEACERLKPEFIRGENVPCANN
ncbi:hypothetical protein [Roseibium sediminicola]|uniref:Uncharacterized protein n=1 Tax=Roseibium sediminicola TaxID=2933272 RepID=A0ABT0GSC7_9HYPH|nr:hypothetical protein [Roseibium sp. CAU 1639]MCK7612352.1 hypothetical protein [Roseibium sp. CAU 1639]